LFDCAKAAVDVRQPSSFCCVHLPLAAEEGRQRALKHLSLSDGYQESVDKSFKGIVVC
jgi:hypothetical protein